MQGWLYEENSFATFFLITALLGGWAAWMTGRSVAWTWRNYSELMLYLFPLTAAVRFIHYALFSGTLLSLHYFVVDFAILTAIATISFRYYKTDLMARQYYWMIEKTGPLGWRERKTP